MRSDVILEKLHFWYEIRAKCFLYDQAIIDLWPLHLVITKILCTD